MLATSLRELITAADRSPFVVEDIEPRDKMLVALGNIIGLETGD